MQLRTITNGREIAERMRKRAEGFGPAKRRAQDRIRSVILEESRRVLANEIYAIPIPRRPRSSKPKWTRAQDLYKKEQVRIRGGNVELVNTSRHAKARRDLGTPAGRPIRSPGVRVVDWQREALHNRMEQIRGFNRQMNREVIEAR